jgi:UDP-glucose 4-epimerase
MRVLLTGASGFVGGYLASALVSAGHDVHALVRHPSAYDAPDGVTLLGADLERLDSDALPRVDAIAHFAQANVPFPDEAGTLYAVNTASTLVLLEHARKCRAQRFLYASSASVYGFGERPFTETDPVSAHDFYATTKINSEQLVGTYGGFFGTAVFRLVAPYGPGQRGRMIPGVIGRVREGRPVTLSGGGRPRMNPIYVADAVRAAVAALELEGNHVVNVAGEEVVGIREIATIAGEALGLEPLFEASESSVTGDLIVDIARMKKSLAPDPLISFHEGLRRTVAGDR